MANITEELITQAKASSGAAYCPYSKFRVGAAVLMQDGLVYTGCNVENASYGLTVCAERNAVFQAIAAGGSRVIKQVVVYTPTIIPSAPCGACRQVINEFGPGAAVLCVCDGRDVIKGYLCDLMPYSFGPHNLEG